MVPFLMVSSIILVLVNEVLNSSIKKLGERPIWNRIQRWVRWFIFLKLNCLSTSKYSSFDFSGRCGHFGVGFLKLSRNEL